MGYSSKLGQYLAANHADKSAFACQDEDGEFRLMGWLPEYGTPPTVAQVEAWTPSPVPGVIQALAAREKLASETITRLKAKAAVALVMGGMSESDAYAAGSAFVVDHSPKIQAYILAGGNPVAGQALIDAVVAQAPAWWSPAMLALFEGELL